MVFKTPNNYLCCSLGQQHGDINEQNKVNLCSRSCGPSPANLSTRVQLCEEILCHSVMWATALYMLLKQNIHLL